MNGLKRLLAAASAAALAFAACPVTAQAAVTVDFADEYGEVISGADYTIMVRLSGKYVTAANDGNVHQWEKLGDDSQVWHIESAGNGKCCILSGKDRKLALTVENGDSTNGNNIYLSEY
ncbi:MAG: RICIN domain-containing protein, partial [Ruminococcus sp.]|nr:RICIN domain-containing protein [Ruminococcus sp.]